METKDTNGNLKTLQSKLRASEDLRLAAESKLGQLEELYQNLFNHLADEVHMWKLIREKEGSIKTWELADVNPAALITWGKQKEKIIGKTADEIFGKGTTEQFMPIVRQIFNTGKPHKWVEYFAPTHQYLSMSSIPMGEYFISTGKDITEEIALQKKLEETADLLNKAESMSSQGSWKWDIKKDEWTFSENWLNIHGFKKSGIGKAELMQMAHPDDVPAINQAFARALAEKEPYDIEHRIIKKDTGEIRWAKVFGEVTFSDNDEPAYMIGIGRDITDEKLTKERLEESKNLLERTGEIAKVGEWQMIGGLVIQTKNVKDLYELPEDYELTTEDAINFYHPDDRAMVTQYVNDAVENGRPFNFEARLITAKGNLKWVLAVGEPEMANGQCVRLSGVFKDITENRKNEEARKKAQQQLLDVANSVPGIIYQFVFHNDGAITMPYINSRAEELLGFGSEKMKDPEFLFSRIHPDDYDSTMSAILEANRDNANWFQEFRALDKNDEAVWIRGQSTGSADRDGNIVHTGVLFDISEQKKAENALRESQQEFQNIADNLAGVIFKYKLNTDGSDELLYMSKGAHQLYEVAPEKALGNIQLIWDLVHQEDVKKIKPSIEQSAKELTPWKFEHRLQFPDGRIKWVDVRGVPVKNTDGSVVWNSIGLDITKQKEAEKELERINKNLEKLVEERAQKAVKLSRELELYWLAAEHAKSGVWHYDVQSNKLEWDDIMYELYGIDKADFSGAYEAWETSLHPEDKERNVRALQETIAGQKDLDILFRINHRKSGEIRHIRGKGKAETDDKGNTVAVFGTNWDVTREMNLAVERERAIDQLKEAQAQLIQSEKMASLGILTAGVAHELNNPLNYIVGGYTAIHNHLNEEELLDKAEIEEYLDWIKTGSDRATKIVKSLNLFSRSNEDNTEVCDIHLIIDDCLLMLQNKFKDRIIITKEYTDTPAEVPGNNGKLHQAILNLLANAVDAISEKGEITIETKSQKDRLNIIISDNGCGISGENLKKVMDPFFTTKPPGEGTGLGLSITHSIIQEHEGSLTLQSTPDAGTKVKISLPKERKHAE